MCKFLFLSLLYALPVVAPSQTTVTVKADWQLVTASPQLSEDPDTAPISGARGLEVCINQFGYAYCPAVVTDGNFSTGVGTDNAATINRAIADAFASTPPINRIQLPCGNIVVRSSINLTNHPGVDFAGCGQGTNQVPPMTSNVTVLICETGIAPCLDTTGSSGHHIHDIYLRMANTYAGVSQVGLLQGRDNAGGSGRSNPFCYDSGFNIERVTIMTGANNRLQDGHGYIGIANVGAENGHYDKVFINANTPMYVDPANNRGFSSSYQTLRTGCPASATGWAVTNSSFGTNMGTGSNGIYVDSTGGAVGQVTLFNHFFLGNGGGGANNNYNIFIHGGASQWTIIGASVEQNQGPSNVLGFDNTLDNFNVTMSIPCASTDSGAILQPLANGLTINNSDFNFIAFGCTLPAMFNNSFAHETFRGGSIKWSDFTQAPGASNWTLVETTVHSSNLSAFAVGSSFNSASTGVIYGSDKLLVLGAFSILNNSNAILGRNASNNGDIPMVGIDRTNGVVLGSNTTVKLGNTRFTTWVALSPPMLAGDGCGGSGARIAVNQGSKTFTVNVGTTPGSACTITMPRATTDWNCSASDTTTASPRVFLQKQTATSATSITITNFNTAGAPAAYVANDSLRVSCDGE